MDWDDYRFFLAIARRGSLTAAAKTLNVSQPTVSRRLAALESNLAARLFDRSSTGYELTSVGLDLLESVEQVDEGLREAERKAHGKDHELVGRLRVTCTEVLLNAYLGPFLWRFLEQNPGIDLTAFTSRNRLNLARNEADVAIRFTGHPPETLTGRRLATLACSLYAAVDSQRFYLGNETDWAWIESEDESFNRTLYAAWPRKGRVRHVTDDTAAMQSMIAEDIGVGMLECYVADRDPRLKRLVPELVIDVKRDLWILYHPNMRRVARIRLFVDYVATTIAMDRYLFEGRAR